MEKDSHQPASDEPKPDEPKPDQPTPDAAAPAPSSLADLGLGQRRVRELQRPRSKKPERRPFLWLRRLLLSVGVLFVIGLVLLLAAYRFGSADETTAAGVKTGTVEAQAIDRDELLSGEGFDYTQTSEGEPVFRIRAEQSRQQRDDTAHLAVVTLDIYRADGSTVTVTSDRATFNETGRQARLEGDVVLNWDRLELRARALELRQQGQILASNGPIQLRYPPNLNGRASILQIDRRTETITLAGGVHIRTDEGTEKPLRLDGERVVYQRDIGLLRAVGEAEINYDGQHIAAHFLTVFMQDGIFGNGVESLRARWNVVGGRETVQEDGSIERIAYRGQFLEMKPDPYGKKDVDSKIFEIHGEDSPVELEMIDPSGLKRTLTAERLEGELRNNRLIRVDGVGAPLLLREGFDLDQPYLTRQACAERATAFFLPDGGISTVLFADQVELTDQDVFLSGGEKATLDLAKGSVDISGTEVTLLGERLEVTAPQLSYSRDPGVVHAGGGKVRARIDERAVEALSRTPLGQGTGPIFIDAEEATWSFAPPTFVFRGAVRAWRDQNLLLADQLRGDEGRKELAASGSVRTVWQPAAVPGRETPDPIRVAAAKMTYSQADRILSYDESVAMTQGTRSLQCEHLAVELTAGGESTRRMVCRDQVRLDDPEGGRRVSGDEAVYTPDARRVEIFGQEVILLDRDNNRMTGRYLDYDLAAGTVSLKSRRPETSGTEENPED